jgi:hypothetical protein
MLLIVSAVLATVMVVVGCSSSSKSSSSVSAGSSTGAAAATATTAKAAASSSSGSSGSSGGVSASQLAGFCGQATANQLANLSQSFATAMSSVQDPSTLQTNLNNLKKVVSQAPSAIQGDLNTFVTYYGKFIQILAQDKNDPSKLGTDMQSISGNQQQLSAAGQRIQAYYQSHCHS